MVSLLTELNAFEKSSLRKTWLSDRLARRWRVALTAASAAPETLTPTWIGCNSPLLRFIMNLLTVLAVNCLRVYPTAIGLMPPSFFCNAISLPPYRISLTSTGSLPIRSRLTNSVSAVFRLSVDALLNMSIKCCAVRPSGPRDEPAGNVRRHVMTSPEHTCRVRI